MMMRSAKKPKKSFGSLRLMTDVSNLTVTLSLNSGMMELCIDRRER